MFSIPILFHTATVVWNFNECYTEHDAEYTNYNSQDKFG